MLWVGAYAGSPGLRMRSVEEGPPKVIDFEVATDLFISAFPGATLAEVYERALGAAANCDLMGFSHEARVLRETAARIKARMTH